MRKIRQLIDGYLLSRVTKSKFESSRSIGRFSRIHRCFVGSMTYVGSNTSLFYCKIGKYSCIASNVKILFGNHPTSVFVSVHPAFYAKRHYSTKTYANKQYYEEFRYLESASSYMVEIGNDVWIASDVRINSGIKIGNGAIVLPGAIVTNDVEDYAIVGGIPAKHIGYRFSEKQIDFLLRFKWWDRSDEWIRENAIQFLDIENFMFKFGEK